MTAFINSGMYCPVLGKARFSRGASEQLQLRVRMQAKPPLYRTSLTSAIVAGGLLMQVSVSPGSEPLGGSSATSPSSHPAAHPSGPTAAADLAHD